MTRNTAGYAHFSFSALYDALDAERSRRGATWAEVAREAGVSASTIQRFRIGGAMEADGVLQLVRWVGRNVESFIPGSESQMSSSPIGRDESGVARIDTRAIYAALESRRLERSMTWRAVAAEIGGVAPSGLTRLRDGGRVEWLLIMRIVDWLGVAFNRIIRLT